MEREVAVWDLPTRLFHWALVVLLGAMVATGKVGGDWLALHVRCGEALAVLLLFRLLWGIVGSQSARFADFVAGPAGVLRYLKSGEAPSPGHNPLGGWMVLALLAVLVLQVSSGLFAADVDSYLFDGPLAHHLAPALAETVTGWHKALFRLVLALGVLHVTAIAAYRLLKRQNLLLPMLTGRKRLPPQIPAPHIASWKVALASFGLALILVLALVALG
jgi:cytochrome b